ncbi:MAG: pyridoxamine 5'-phosphate oxidase family protein [Deltaproteobacteria bacterium]|nr:pyridoxamine 5'-phosphate oxidase family protein [Deltaproteobacteria bacterium]
MRVAKKEILDRKVIDTLLAAAPVGRLGTIGRDGYPMVKPLNFVYREKRIYFHSALSGEKIESILQDGRVCFEVDRPLLYVKSRGIPCNADYLYQSVIIRGRACVVAAGQEKITALRALMEKYQPEGGYGDFPDDRLAVTAVVRIDILEMKGKQDLGKEGEQEAVQRIIHHQFRPVAVLERF